MSNRNKIAERRKSPLHTPSDIGPQRVKEISGALNALLADVFTLYLKTKNFHWHMSGPHFRDYHLLLDEHADQIFAMTDDIAERVRKIGGTTIRSIGHISRLRRIADNDAEFVDSGDMLGELREDEKGLVLKMQAVHGLCDDSGDVPRPAFLKTGLIRRSAVSGSCLKHHAPDLQKNAEVNPGRAGCNCRQGTPGHSRHPLSQRHRLSTSL